MSFVFSLTKLSAFNGNDSTKTIKPPRHYFNNTIYADYYFTGKRNLDTINKVSKKLESYQVRQFSLGYNFPIITKDFYNKDSTRISNMHLLISGSYNNLAINFGGITKHNLTKLSIGCRGFYNNGKRSIFFAEVAPFLSVDGGYSYTRTYRLAATVLYDFSADSYFSFRLGYTRTYLWGNRYHLPYIGIRVGKLDKTNLSIQFPRSATFTVPIGRYVKTSLFTRPQGGLYTFANVDSLQVGNVLDNKKLYFGRYEFLSGLRVDILPSKYFNFYLSGGLTTRNKISLYPTPKTNDKLSKYGNDYNDRVKRSVFINFGFVFRFGKTKSIYNNTQMYNTLDINNNIGNNGALNGNGNIPSPATKFKKNNPNEVLDLIETQDLY